MKFLKFSSNSPAQLVERFLIFEHLNLGGCRTEISCKKENAGTIGRSRN